MNITIDPEFQSLVFPLNQEEKELLKKSLLREGCRDALVVWNGVILDGHHRYEICKRHDIDFRVANIELEDRNSAKIWIIENQFGRRNLSNFQRAELALKLKPMIEAKARERQKGGQGGALLRQNSDKAIDTKKKLASQAEVSHDTIWKVEKIKESNPSENTINQLRTGELSINQAYKETKKAHVSRATGENEWYTPKNLIEKARKTMGSIDVDPASSEAANQIIQAKAFYDLQSDGLIQKWNGNVWMNPPYSQPLINQFSKTICEKYLDNEIEQACILVNNATETEWLQRILNIASAVCFIKGRLRFIDKQGLASGAPLQGQVILYFGKNIESFHENFQEIGVIYDKR